MRLFISYSHDDKSWVEELHRELREDHDPWLDKQISGASDWWNTILDEIDECDCFIYILTPKSAESPYCQEEMKYAKALNKPILPLMLKNCSYPDVLDQHRIQYLDIAGLSVEKVIRKILNSFLTIKDDIRSGKYDRANTPRPLEPRIKKNDAEETFRLAEEALAANNFSVAEELFQQVVKSDPSGWGIRAIEYISKLSKSKSKPKKGRPEREVSGNVARFSAISQKENGKFSIPQKALQATGAIVGSSCHFLIRDAATGSILCDDNYTIRGGRVVYDADGLPPYTNIDVYMTFKPPK